MTSRWRFGSFGSVAAFFLGVESLDVTFTPGSQFTLVAATYDVKHPGTVVFCCDLGHDSILVFLQWISIARVTR